jgi:GDP-L-fucose synthase
MDRPSTRLVATGGAGFLGSVVVQKLRARGCQQVFVPSSRGCDLKLVRRCRVMTASRNALPT